MRALANGSSRFVLAGLVLSVCFCASADEPSDRWKRHNDLGNRYEGRIEVLVGRPQLEVVSLLGYREAYDSSDTVDLRVLFFVPESGEVKIQARELEDQTQYFMEAKAQEWAAGEWHEFGPWSTGDVLSREQVAASNVGVVVSLRERSEENSSQILLPAFVYHAQTPSRVVAYTLRLRPDSDLREVRYLLRAGEDEVFSGKLVDSLKAGEAFPIKLDVADVPNGQLKLEIEGRFKNRPAGPKASFEIYHQGLGNDG